MCGANLDVRTIVLSFTIRSIENTNSNCTGLGRGTCTCTCTLYQICILVPVPLVQSGCGCPITFFFLCSVGTCMIFLCTYSAPLTQNILIFLKKTYCWLIYRGNFAPKRECGHRSVFPFGFPLNLL